MMIWPKRVLLGLAGLVALIVAGGTIYEQIARHEARTRHEPPGRLIDIGGRMMHLDCRGHGAPLVVLEAGLDTNGSISWSAVHDRLAANVRTCAYDRAGIMWSKSKSTPQDGEAVAMDLHRLLAAAGETGPFVMVGHSLGGPYVMNFARLYGDDVAGIVFVDASHPDQAKRFKSAGMPAAAPSRTQSLLAALGWSGLVRWMVPPDDFPGIPADASDAAAAYIPTSFGSAWKEVEALDRTLDQAGKLRDLGDRPLVVLTGAKPLPMTVMAQAGFSPAQAATQAAVWKRLHDEEAAWSRRSRHEIVTDAGHYIQFERPDVVIHAILDVVAQVRDKH
jgi:pimeloyl-ACP methyl ester carboxylesterase